MIKITSSRRSGKKKINLSWLQVIGLIVLMCGIFSLFFTLIGVFRFLFDLGLFLCFLGGFLVFMGGIVKGLFHVREFRENKSISDNKRIELSSLQVISICLIICGVLIIFFGIFYDVIIERSWHFYVFIVGGLLLICFGSEILILLKFKKRKQV
jgi:MFS family permease